MQLYATHFDFQSIQVHYPICSMNILILKYALYSHLVTNIDFNCYFLCLLTNFEYFIDVTFYFQDLF